MGIKMRSKSRIASDLSRALMLASQELVEGIISGDDAIFNRRIADARIAMERSVALMNMLSDEVKDRAAS